MKNPQDHRFYGVPWFDDIGEYKKYLELFDDDEDPNEAYAEWLALATADFVRNKAVPNSTVRKVIIKVDEFVAFCQQKSISVEDSSALNALVGKKLQRWIDAKIRQPKGKPKRIIAGYAWFDSREEYEKCAGAAAESGDGRHWETYDKWKATAERDFRLHQSAGRHTTIKVVINADEFLRYCRTAGRRINPQSRLKFINKKLEEQFDDKIF
jgi:hypothetical protein